MKTRRILRIEGANFSAYIDCRGNIQRIIFQNRPFKIPLESTFYEINGEIAGVAEMPNEEQLSLKLTTKEASGKLTISSGKEMRFHFEPDSNDAVKNMSLVLSFPVDTEFHLPEYMNLGRKIDRDMPVGAWYSTSRYSEGYSYMRGLNYNFFLARLRDMWIRFMTKQDNNFQRMRGADFHITRHLETFSVTFTWRAPDDAFMAVFSSMDDATRDYKTWLGKELGVKRLRDRPNLPKWVQNVKLVLTLDMMLSNWEIAHDYSDVANLARELREIGCPKDTVFYLPGWNGAYDSTYPTYRPHPELGGEEKFKEMMDTVHANGFRVMIHTNAWGLDPYHPDIDRYLKYALKDKNGNYAGFKTGTFTKWGHIAPTLRPLKFRSNKILFESPRGTKSFTFKTVHFPCACEALITVGNLNVNDARVRFTVDRRSRMTPHGWFKDHDEYDFPFPLLMQPGPNKVNVEVLGDTEPDWSRSWYKIRYCPYTGTGGHPILFADTDNPEWIDIFVSEVASFVKEYDIDIVHMDATDNHSNKKLCDSITEKLPNIPLAGESFSTLSALGFWTFMQQAMQSMLGYLDVMQGTRKQGSLPDFGKLEEFYSWLNKPSPVSDFVTDYVCIYPHLIAADAFVPLPRFQSQLSPRNKDDLWKVLRDARRLNYVPGLRLNYRKYGLDEETRRAIEEIASN